MTQEEKQTLLAELAKSAYGEALREHIADALEEVGDVSNCTSWDDTLGRKLSKDFLTKTFFFLDKNETTKTQRTQYT
jgi:hypothetical protein